MPGTGLEPPQHDHVRPLSPVLAAVYELFNPGLSLIGNEVQYGAILILMGGAEPELGTRRQISRYEYSR